MDRPRTMINHWIWTLCCASFVLCIFFDRVNSASKHLWTSSFDYDPISFLDSELTKDEGIFSFLNRPTRQAQKCRNNQWKCRNGQCISFNLHCDGKFDCTDQSDETAGTCGKIKCASYLFQCEYGACVDGDAKCNNVKDCVDNSDELDKYCKNDYVRHNDCGAMSYQCRNSRCIKSEELCDGEKNCEDGSDENLDACAGNYCRSYLFKCAYGACVDGDAPCNGIEECADGSDEAPDLCNKTTVSIRPPTTTTEVSILQGQCITPPFPESGTYKLASVAVEPGTIVEDGSALLYKCNKNYFPTPVSATFCLEGIWNDNIQCIKACDELQSTTVTFTCYHRGENIQCGKDMLNGTFVTSSCKEHHETPMGFNLKNLTCIRGVWDNPTPYCVPECGHEKGQGTGLSIGGFKEKHGNSPWHVGIYKIDSNTFTQMCGGTILSNRLVLSAAHCFSEDRIGTINPPELYAVGAGKYYRSWDSPEDLKFEHVQRVLVERIITPERYGGPEQNFGDDIALVILKQVLKLSDSVHPICYNFQSTSFLRQLTNGTLGKGVGWGVTKEGDINSASETLQAVTIPIIDYQECKKGIPGSLRRYLTADKFCAGWSNGTALCSGDSGGGLVFKSIVNDEERWYIRGVVSVGSSDETGSTCKMDTYTIFTDIYRHRDLIVDTIDKYK